MKLVSVLISCDDVQQENVFRARVKTGHSELHLREHLPSNKPLIIPVTMITVTTHRPDLVITISVPMWWNSSHSWLDSSLTAGSSLPLLLLELRMLGRELLLVWWCMVVVASTSPHIVLSVV